MILSNAGIKIYVIVGITISSALTAAFALSSSRHGYKNSNKEGKKNGIFEGASSDNARKIQNIPPTPCNRICRYNAEFFNGEVCIGCFRDVHEISHWGAMTSLEKGYALEDAVERSLSGSFLEGSVSSDDLKKQAVAWMEDKNMHEEKDEHEEKDNVKGRGREKSPNSSDADDNLRLDYGAIADVAFLNQVVSESNSDPFIKLADNIGVPSASANASAGESDSACDEKTILGSDTNNSDTNNISSPKKKHKHLQNKKNALASSSVAAAVPSTPCTRICRYNKSFYDGQVCIGCFRDSHEISTWASLSQTEKLFALEDAADRCRDVENSDNYFDGGISSHELDRQAQWWRNGDDREEQEQEQESVPSTATATAQREQEGQSEGWREFDIETQETQHSCCSYFYSSSTQTMNYDKFTSGQSVIVLPSIVSPNECDKIIHAARTIASRHRSSRVAKGLADEGLARIPCISAARRAEAGNRNAPCAEAIDRATDDTLNDILRQVCHVLDEDHGTLVDLLFGLGGGEADADADISSLLLDLFKNDELSFSSREPAVNIYTQGGEFRPHSDGHKLTILIPLSSPDDFTGGGTAFWSQDSGHRVDPPSLTLKPGRGSPMLFVGHVVHSGVAVEEGERVVFVASFNRVARSVCASSKCE